MSEERTRMLEEMFRSSPDALIVVDDQGLIEAASPTAEKLFGYPGDELLGQPVELLVPDAIRDLHVRHRRAYGRAPEGRPMGVGLDLRARNRDGSVFAVDVSLVPTTVNGRLRVGAFVRDATDRRRGEDLFRFVNEISRGVIAGEPTPGLLQMASEKARTLLGATASWISVQSPERDVMVVAASDGEAAESLMGAVVPASSVAMAPRIPSTRSAGTVMWIDR